MVTGCSQPTPSFNALANVADAGSLSFPNGLKAAAGRPSVPPASPVMFDVQLLYIPGLEDDE